jgi:hypothetical protein
MEYCLVLAQQVSMAVQEQKSNVDLVTTGVEPCSASVVNYPPTVVGSEENLRIAPFENWMLNLLMEEQWSKALLPDLPLPR